MTGTEQMLSVILLLVIMAVAITADRPLLSHFQGREEM